MSTQPQIPQHESSEVVNLSFSFARNYWCSRLNAPLSLLKEAIQASGPRLDDVKRYLAQKRETANADGGIAS